MSELIKADQIGTYDPIIYDILQDTATELGGQYIYLARQASTEAAHQAFMQADCGVQAEVAMVDISDVAAVRAKTAELVARLRAIRQADVEGNENG